MPIEIREIEIKATVSEAGPNAIPHALPEQTIEEIIQEAVNRAVTLLKNKYEP